MDEKTQRYDKDAAIEKRVTELEKTIERMVPGRRAILEGVGAMGLIGLNFSGGASASTSNDEPALGSAENRVNIYANEIDTLSTNADKIESIAEHVITSQSELEALPDNLEDGDTVWVGQVEHDSVIEIDGVNEVTITGSGIGSSRITTAGGANSDLFHIGHNSTVGKIRIQNLTIDGNTSNNDGNTDHAIPIWTEDIDHLVVDRVNFVNTIGTSGVGEAGENTSTIRAYYPARKVEVRNCEFHGNVTRHVEASCEELHVFNSFFENSHERNISLDSLVKNNRISQKAYIKDNDLRIGEEGGSAGAHIGAEGLDSTTVGTTPVTPVGDPIEEYIFKNNMTRGEKRTGITVRDATQGQFFYSDNVINGAIEHGIINYRENSDQSIVNEGSITVLGGQINDTGTAALRLGNSSTVHVQGMVCDGNRITVRPAGHISVIGCEIHNATQSPSVYVDDALESCKVRNCSIINPSGTSIRAVSTGSEIHNCDVIGLDNNNDGIRIDADEARITNCYIEGDSDSLPRHGIFCTGVNDVVGIGNVAKNISGHAFQLHKSTGEDVFNFTQPVSGA